MHGRGLKITVDTSLWLDGDEEPFIKASLVGDLSPQDLRASQDHTPSTHKAIPIPPPMQRVARPRLTLRRFNS